jgi:hypothetical protein
MKAFPRDILALGIYFVLLLVRSGDAVSFFRSDIQSVYIVKYSHIPLLCIL